MDGVRIAHSSGRRRNLVCEYHGKYQIYFIQWIYSKKPTKENTKERKKLMQKLTRWYKPEVIFHRILLFDFKE